MYWFKIMVIYALFNVKFVFNHHMNMAIHMYIGALK